MKKLLFLILILCLFSALLIGCTVEGGEYEPIITQINVDGFGNNVFYQFDDLNLDDIKLILTYKNGKTSSIPATEDMVSGYNSQNLGKQTITFTYKKLTTAVDIEIREAIAVGIEITSKPDKLEFIQGTSKLNLNDVVLSIMYSNDRKIPLPPISMEMISGYNPQAIGKQTITINYDKFSTSLEILIKEKNIVGISVAQRPTITSYYVTNDGKIDNTGLVLQIEYDNAEKELVDTLKLAEMFTEDELKFEYDLSKPSNKTYVNISLELDNRDALKTRYDIEVKDLVFKSMTIIKMPLSNTITLDGVLQERRSVDDLVEGLDIDWSTGKVAVTLNDDSVQEYSMDSPYISKYNYNKDKVGRATIKIVYKGNENWFTPLEINIKEKVGHKINFINLDDVFDGNYYYVGSKINLSFLEYEILYDNGESSEILSYSNDILAPNSSLECGIAGVKIVILRIAGLQVPIEVVVEDVRATSLIVTPPTKNYQKTGTNNLNLSGSSYTAILSNNKTAGGVLEHSMLTYYYNGSVVDNFSQSGEYTISVEFSGLSKEFKINIADNLVREETISITKPLAKTSFFLLEFTTIEQWYEEFAKIEFSYTDENNISDTANITPEMVYKFAPYQEGKQTIEFRFRGVIFKYDIEIIGLLVSQIGVDMYPQRNFRLNQPFNADGLTIERIYNDNSKDYIYDIENNVDFEIIVPDMSSIGTKTVIIKYTTQNNVLTTSYDIDVSDLTIMKIGIDYVPNTEHNNDKYFEDYNSNGIEYKVLKVIKGQPLNLYGIYMTVTYNEINQYGQNFTTYIPLNNVTNNYEDNVTLENNLRQVKLEYNGFETSIYILIIDDTISRIEVTKTPSRTLFAEGQEISLIGGELTVYYGKGSVDTIPLTSHYIILKSYNPNPFVASDKPGSIFKNPVVIEYKGYQAIFEVSTIKKMLPTLSYQNITGFYGEEIKPRIAVIDVPEFFIPPELHLEYFVDGEWTTKTPRLPGEYSLKVTVNENDFYIASEIIDKKLQIMIKLARVTIDTKVKVYGDQDPTFTYSISGLVGKDTIGFRLFREDTGEDVKYDPISNAIMGYNINAELIPSFGDNVNQNAYYYIEFTKSTLTINPIEPTEVYFGNTNFVYDGEVKNFNIDYSTGNIRKSILQKDILYYRILEDGSVELVEEIIDTGKYKAVISKNYKINGENEVIITVT